MNGKAQAGAWFAIVVAMLGCATYSAVERERPAGAGSDAAAPGTTTGSNVNVPIMANPDARPADDLDGGFAPPPNPGPIVVTAGSVPADVAERFGKATAATDASGPVLVYPTVETMFPPDLGRILFQ